MCFLGTGAGTSTKGDYTVFGKNVPVFRSDVFRDLLWFQGEWGKTGNSLSLSILSGFRRHSSGTSGRKSNVKTRVRSGGRAPFFGEQTRTEEPHHYRKAGEKDSSRIRVTGYTRRNHIRVTGYRVGTAFTGRFTAMVCTRGAQLRACVRCTRTTCSCAKLDIFYKYRSTRPEVCSAFATLRMPRNEQTNHMRRGLTLRAMLRACLVGWHAAAFVGASAKEQLAPAHQYCLVGAG